MMQQVRREYARRLKKRHQGFSDAFYIDGVFVSIGGKQLLKNHQGEPRKIVTDKLKSYGVAHRAQMPETIHDTTQYAKNRVELSHQPTRVRERGMHRFKSTRRTQRFLSVHAAVYSLFNLGRHVVLARHYRNLRQGAFKSWGIVPA